MMRVSLFLLSLSLLFISIDAAFPTVDFTGLLQKYATTTDGTWCTKCAAFGQPPCAMGCAGDGGGGGPCPANACPRLFTFPIVNNQPIWNIQVATVGDPYRAFSYIPLCTQASQCTESFFFSFSFKYTPGPNAAQSNFFSQQRDYLKLLFWGDGNNILGVKNGQLLGLPNGGGGDLVGSNNIGTGNAFAIPFLKDTWTHVGVQFNVQNGRTSLAFFINGVATGSTTGSVAIQNSGLQFGAYVWNGAFFTLQYKDIAITKNLPNVATGTTTTATPVTAKPTTAPTIAPPTPAPVNPTQGFPNVDFTALLQKYATTTDGTWCSKCAAFQSQPCVMGCAGDGGGGGPCPVNACPRLFTFPIVNAQPIWNINVQTFGDPYRAFSYIPICIQASQCIESFFFSFSFKYTPDATSAQTNFFSETRDYLKLLFWGDGNNILGVKNGQLLGLPNGGGGDLVGSNNIGNGNAFAIPFFKDTWTHVGVQFNVQNGRTSLAFFINGIATGSTTGSVAVSNTGLQFGAYVWNGAKFTLQYKDIAITKNLPIVTNGGGTATTATPTTATGKPTTTALPTAKVTSAPTPTATAKPTVPIKSTTTIPPTVTTSMPTETTPPIVDTVTSPPSVVTEPPLDDTTNPPLDDTTDPPSSTDPPAVTTREPTSPPAGAGGPAMPIYNPATVALHNKATDCWTILDGIVYDISKLVLIHPGGPVIRSYCGIDCSTIFSSSHQNDAADRALLAKSYLKGTLGSMTTSKPTNPAIISIVSRSNHATTITSSSALCMTTSLIVAVVLEYFL